MRLMLAFLCILSLFTMVGCGDEEQPLEPESQLSFESENLAPLLNTEGGQLFVKAPWDVNGDGHVDLFDLVLVANHFGQRQVQAAVAAAPDAVMGDLKKGTVLDNGLYRIEIIDLDIGVDSYFKRVNLGEGFKDRFQLPYGIAQSFQVPLLRRWYLKSVTMSITNIGDTRMRTLSYGNLRYLYYNNFEDRYEVYDYNSRDPKSYGVIGRIGIGETVYAFVPQGGRRSSAGTGPLVSQTLYHQLFPAYKLMDQFTLEDGVETLQFGGWRHHGIERVAFQLYDVFEEGEFAGEVAGTPIVFTLNPVLEKQDILFKDILAFLRENGEVTSMNCFLSEFWDMEIPFFPDPKVVKVFPPVGSRVVENRPVMIIFDQPVSQASSVHIDIAGGFKVTGTRRDVRQRINGSQISSENHSRLALIMGVNDQDVVDKLLRDLQIQNGSVAFFLAKDFVDSDGIEVLSLSGCRRLVFKIGNYVLDPPDKERPLLVASSIKDGDKDVDPDFVNRNGIWFEFNEHICWRGDGNSIWTAKGSFTWKASYDFPSKRLLLKPRNQINIFLNKREYWIRPNVFDLSWNNLINADIEFETK